MTLGVVAARQGDLDGAIAHGRQGLAGDRKSVPSLVLVSRDLAETLQRDYASEPQVHEYLAELRGLAA